jgi:hypothetical protein
MTVHMPIRKYPTATSAKEGTAPKRAAEISSKSKALAALPTMSTVRGLARSMITPTGIPRIRNGAAPRKFRAPICSAVAPRTTTATTPMT